MYYGRLAGRTLVLLALGGRPASGLGDATPVDPPPRQSPAPSAEVGVEGLDAGVQEPEGEPPLVEPGVEGDYLRLVHSHIHWAWADNFIDGLLAKRPPTDPLNKPSLEAEVLFTVRWDGSTAEATLSRSSGNKEFDRAALQAVRGVTRYPVPPLEIFGDDGVAHFRWVLARDRRRCSDGELRRVEAPLEQALPRLFLLGRKKEALLRAVRLAREGQIAAMSTFARAFLALPNSDPAVDARAAAALARDGDLRQRDRLRPALKRADSVAIAAPALAALKVDLCPLVQADLGSPDPAPALVASRALREAHVELPGTSLCLAALRARIEDPAVPSVVRADMLRTLAAVDPAGAHRLLTLSLSDSDGEMRAAAAAAIARPDGGRPVLYRLEPLLRDPVPGVRAAAAAGLVRATGGLSFDYLRPLFKQGDVSSLVALASELGRQSSPASADLLAKMLKRNEQPLRRAVMEALAARQDAPARALLRPLVQAVKKDMRASSESRILAYSNADLDELRPFSRDPALGPILYRTLLRAERHDEAIDWLVAAFDRLPPETVVDAFAAWLATQPPRVATTSTPSKR